MPTFNQQTGLYESDVDLDLELTRSQKLSLSLGEKSAQIKNNLGLTHSQQRTRSVLSQGQQQGNSGGEGYSVFGGRKFQNSNAFWNNDSEEQRQQALSDTADQQLLPDGNGGYYQEINGQKVPFNGKARTLYIGSDKKGRFTKTGVSALSFKERYTPGSGDNGKYGWAPGSAGVDPNDPNVAELVLPADVADGYEQYSHGNIQDTKNRVVGLESNRRLADALGGGSSEYKDASTVGLEDGYKLQEGTPQTSLNQSIESRRALNNDQVKGSFFDTSGDSGFSGENLLRGVGSGAITVGAGIADAVTTLGANIVQKVDDKLDLDFYSKEEEAFAKGFFDTAKETKWADEATGYSREFSDAQLEKSLKHFKNGNVLQGMFEGIKAGPDVTAQSLAYMATLFNLPGMGLVISSEFNDSIDAWKKNNNGEEPTAQRMAVMLLADTVKVAMEKIPFSKAIKGKSSVVDAVKKILDGTPKGMKKQVASSVGKRLAVVSGNIAEETGQEGVQFIIDYLNREYGTKNDKGFNTDEFYKSMIAGGAAGGATGGARQAPGLIVDATKQTFDASTAKTQKRNARASAQNIREEDREFVESLEDANIEKLNSDSKQFIETAAKVDDLTVENIEEAAKEIPEIQQIIDGSKNDNELELLEKEYENKSELASGLDEKLVLFSENVSNEGDFEKSLNALPILKKSGLPKSASREQIETFVSNLSVKDKFNIMKVTGSPIGVESSTEVSQSLVDNVKEIMSQSLTHKSTAVKQLIADKTRDQKEFKKTETKARTNSTVGLKNKIDSSMKASFIASIPWVKNRAKVLDELRGFSTEALNEFKSREGSTAREQRFVDRVLNDRRNADKASNVNQAKASVPILSDEQVMLDPLTAIKSVKSNLSVKEITDKNSADQIEKNIIQLVAQGELNDKQGNILIKRLRKLSKDATVPEDTTTTKDAETQAEPESPTETSEADTQNNGSSQEEGSTAEQQSTNKSKSVNEDTYVEDDKLKGIESSEMTTEDKAFYKDLVHNKLGIKDAKVC